MKYTNKYNYPQPLHDAIIKINSSYNRGDADFTATELTKPYLMRHLQFKRKDDIVVDVSDLIWMVYGSVVHELLENTDKNNKSYKTEERLTGKYDKWVVSGKYDVYYPDDNHLQDYKTTKAWSYVFDRDGKSDWVYQLNTLASLSRQKGREIDRLSVYAIYRDWAESSGLRNKNYPPRDSMLINIKLMKEGEIRDWIIDRCNLHSKYRSCDIIDIPECTPEEMYSSTDKWAVIIDGRKKAKRLFSNKESAEKYIDKINNKKCKIEYRPGRRIMCERYCNVSKWCHFYEKYKERKSRGAE